MCKTCEVVAKLDKPEAECLVDLKCPECCVRHIMKTIEHLGTWGGDGHGERIKDRLLERLLGHTEG